MKIFSIFLPPNFHRRSKQKRGGAEEFIKKQSAKITGRPIFNEMIERIENSGANAILAWHPDRYVEYRISAKQILVKIARDNDLLQKKVMAKEIFGPNLVLAGAEARVSAPESSANAP